MYHLSAKQIQKLKARSNTLLTISKRRKRFVRKKLLAQVIGYYQSTCLALPTGRLHLTSLYSDLHTKPGWLPNTSVKLSNASVSEIEHFWLSVPLTA